MTFAVALPVAVLFTLTNDLEITLLTASYGCTLQLIYISALTVAIRRMFGARCIVVPSLLSLCATSGSCVAVRMRPPYVVLNTV